MILADNETRVDLLNNEAIAACIIALLSEQPSRPVTVGVHGDWGAGKSSILEMIEAGLGSSGDVLCLKFNGWRFQGCALTLCAPNPRARVRRSRLLPTSPFLFIEFYKETAIGIGVSSAAKPRSAKRLSKRFVCCCFERRLK
jgi:hypothetical protein